MNLYIPLSLLSLGISVSNRSLVSTATNLATTDCPTSATTAETLQKSVAYLTKRAFDHISLVDLYSADRWIAGNGSTWDAICIFPPTVVTQCACSLVGLNTSVTCVYGNNTNTAMRNTDSYKFDRVILDLTVKFSADDKLTILGVSMARYDPHFQGYRGVYPLIYLKNAIRAVFAKLLRQSSCRLPLGFGSQSTA
ncbi:hypothetical protein Aperf_G00000108009 [Anoplocephala perfoliata]